MSAICGVRKPTYTTPSKASLTLITPRAGCSSRKASRKERKRPAISAALAALGWSQRSNTATAIPHSKPKREGNDRRAWMSEKYSWSPRAVHSSSTAEKSQAGAQQINPIRRGSARTAVSSLVRSTRDGLPRHASEFCGRRLFSGSAKTALAILIISKRPEKLLAAKIRPQRICHINFRVRQLP